MMRASEALMIGSTYVKPKRGVFYNHDAAGGGEGCALGMMSLAKFGVQVALKQHDVGFAWIKKLTPIEFPCGCEKNKVVMGGGGHPEPCDFIMLYPQTMIVHLFNQHVIDGDWTIEQLADWIESIDPTPRALAPAEVLEPVDSKEWAVT